MCTVRCALFDACCPMFAAAAAAGGRPALQARTPEEELRSFVLEHFLGDEDLARESEAARGAAHYDTAEYWVRRG